MANANNMIEILYKIRDIKGVIKLKIACVSDGKNISGHFGHCNE
ncbi:hypothetical protein JTS93_13860 [Clostridium botulinum]|nr:hypothetical protein [Clostridium botulinum]